MPSGIYSKVNRVGPALVEEAKNCGISDLHEAMGTVLGRAGLMSMRMRPLKLGQHAAGPAVTAWCPPGDNLMMHCALYYAQPGDVLVINSGLDGAGSQWGDLAAMFARERGVAGVVVAGGIRDVNSLSEMNFPVWSTAVSPAHSEKKALGMVNGPLICDGVQVDPGDLVVADGDGVIVIPKAQAADILAKVRARRDKESAMIEAMRKGETLFELVGLGKSPADSQLQVLDRAWDD